VDPRLGIDFGRRIAKRTWLMKLEISMQIRAHSALRKMFLIPKA
jgi:hypothetical protein